MGYLALKFFHIVGFVLIGGGLVGVFLTDLRSRQTRDIRLIAEACRYVAIFYDGVVVPGAILAGLSGLFLTLGLGAGFFELPWLTGMWVLFLVIVLLGALRPPTWSHFSLGVPLALGVAVAFTLGFLRTSRRHVDVGKTA